MNKIIELLQASGVEVTKLDDGIEFDLSAQPGSKKERITLDGKGGLKLSLTARAVEGAANKAISKYLSKKLGGSVEIVRGQLSKRKRIRINYFFTDHKDIDYYCDKWNKLLLELK